MMERLVVVMSPRVRSGRVALLLSAALATPAPLPAREPERPVAFGADTAWGWRFAAALAGLGVRVALIGTLPRQGWFTRASIIEGLIYEDYVHRNGRELQPTAKAFDLLYALSRFEIDELRSPELTGDWEFKLKQIEQGKLRRDAFMDHINGMRHSTAKGTFMMRAALSSTHSPGIPLKV